MIIAAFASLGIALIITGLLMRSHTKKVNEMSVYALIHLRNYGEQSGRSIQEYLHEAGFRFHSITFYAMMVNLAKRGDVKVRSQQFCVIDGKPHPPYKCSQGYVEVTFYRLPSSIPTDQALVGKDWLRD